MDDISTPRVSSSSSISIASNSTTPSAQELRQKLLQQIYEFNTDTNTPPELRVHVTGLTLEEGAVFESHPSPVAGSPESQTPTSSPPVSASLPADTVLDTENLPSETPNTSSPESQRGAPRNPDELTHWRIAEITLRDLRREKETLLMEGRRRAAKEQVDARWQERALKDWKENKAMINYEIVPGADGRDEAIITGVQYPDNGSGSGGGPHENQNNGRIRYNIGRGEDVLQGVVIDRVIRDGECGKRNEEVIPKAVKKSSPKAPKGLRQLAESRRKTNVEWIAKEGHRLAAREIDESTRKNLLNGINRAIAVAEGVALKGAEHFIGFMNGDGPRKNATDSGDKHTNKDSRVQDKHPLAYPRPGHVPPLPARPKTKSEYDGGKGHGKGQLESVERGRRRVHRTRETYPNPHALDEETFPRERANPQRQHVKANTGHQSEYEHRERRAAGDTLSFTRELSPLKAQPLHQRCEPVKETLKKDLPIQTARPAQTAEKRPLAYPGGTNIPVRLISPLVPKVANPRPKPESLPIIFPVPAIRDSRLLPKESPAQWKFRMQRETANAKFEKRKLEYKEEVEAAKKSEKVGPAKGILKRDRKGKGKVIAWADGPTDNESEGKGSLKNKTPSFNERADQEELRKLDEKRQKREGKYKCLATESKIQRENLAARERAEELAETLMHGGGGTEDQRGE